MSFDLADRGIYGFATSEHLRFADVDANGHVNNGAFIELLENARVSYLRQIVRSGLPRFRLVIGRIEADFKRQMFFPGTATACARLIEAHQRKVVIGQALFDGESQCTARSSNPWATDGSRSGAAWRSALRRAAAVGRSVQL